MPAGDRMLHGHNSSCLEHTRYRPPSIALSTSDNGVSLVNGLVSMFARSFAHRVRGAGLRALVMRQSLRQTPVHGTTQGLQMRKQYYFRESPQGLLAWDVDRLVELSSALPRKIVPLNAIRELHESWLSDGEGPGALTEHLRLIDEADLSFPIILSANGAVMDGRHRVAKAARQGRLGIEAVQFDEDPNPDFVGLGPDDLPY